MLHAMYKYKVTFVTDDTVMKNTTGLKRVMILAGFMFVMKVMFFSVIAFPLLLSFVLQDLKVCRSTVAVASSLLEDQFEDQQWVSWARTL